jgi:hypothetical protein
VLRSKTSLPKHGLCPEKRELKLKVNRTGPVAEGIMAIAEVAVVEAVNP